MKLPLLLGMALVSETVPQLVPVTQTPPAPRAPGWRLKFRLYRVVSFASRSPLLSPPLHTFTPDSSHPHTVTCGFQVGCPFRFPPAHQLPRFPWDFSSAVLALSSHLYGVPTLPPDTWPMAPAIPTCARSSSASHCLCHPIPLPPCPARESSQPPGDSANSPPELYPHPPMTENKDPRRQQSELWGSQEMEEPGLPPSPAPGKGKKEPRMGPPPRTLRERRQWGGGTRRMRVAGEGSSGGNPPQPRNAGTWDPCGGAVWGRERREGAREGLPGGQEEAPRQGRGGRGPLPAGRREGPGNPQDGPRRRGSSGVGRGAAGTPGGAGGATREG